MIFDYNSSDLSVIRNFKLYEKSHSANNRFTDQITPIDILNTLKRFDFTCIYCCSKLDSKTWQLDHFYPRAMGGKNKPHNLAPSCKWCNQMKGALAGWAFIEKCKKIVENNFLDQRLFNQQ